MTKKKTTQEKQETSLSQKNPLLTKELFAQPQNYFPIVAIGASAGGLEALEEFFRNVPEDNKIAFVVIQHLDPNRIGMMPELLQRTTTMKVFQVTDELKVKSNCIYVIPPNKSMSILNGKLHLFEPLESHGLRLPIDIFFRSLADDRKEKSICIILSGMGSDGSLGAKAIKEKNGIVIVQDPSSAKFDGMPRSATESVIPDIVAPAGELPSKLSEYLKIIPVVKKYQETEEGKNNIDKIIILLREQSGHDFSLYKKSTLFRRIERRKAVHQLDRIQSYVRFLQENPQEVQILFKELLIGVTSFFRDKDVWEKLSESILTDIINELPDGHVLRVWVPACSTGEEAYSLGIIFKEVLEKLGSHKSITLQIFATDLDKDAIEEARRGIFSSNITADVSAERLRKFFTVGTDGKYRINKSIREIMIFAPQNVIKDPPFTRIDFISCRNMLIYMEQELQKHIFDIFNYALNPGGIMLLGTAETLGSEDNRFEELDAGLKIYKHYATVPSSGQGNFPRSFYHKHSIKTEKETFPKVIENIQTIADQLLLQRFAPPSLLVNATGDIIYITGHTGKYLEPAAGKANWNIHAIAREGLRYELTSALRKAMQSFEVVSLHNIKVGTNGGVQFVDLILQQMENPDAIKGMIMIVFKDVTSIPQETEKPDSTGDKNESDIEFKRIYQELQSTREEMLTSQEELKSINEEFQSTNEELQSTNEELITSKEEMQSMNEELQTVNIELQNKLNDFLRENSDMKNLLNSTEIATLFLDKELNIRRFTDEVTKIFKLRSTDIGRPFTDQTTILIYPEMEKDVLKVLKTLVPIETAIITNNGKWFSVRIIPYRTFDDRIDGLVITFIDITKVKKIELDLKEANNKIQKIKENYEATLDKSHVIIAINDCDLKYIWIYNQNPNFDSSVIIGKRDDEIIKNDEAIAVMRLKKLVIDTGLAAQTQCTLPVSDAKAIYDITAQPLKNAGGKLIGVSTIAFDTSYFVTVKSEG